ncbi:hypothetical protein BJY01DRAFT_198089 [Aspergillus pseudoustus]|uniref:Uncharacterized protein n=1 Tax=Aspergillus pseudoustus TaxID=1810923 RepID=A0ABR4JTG7_9EURO
MRIMRSGLQKPGTVPFLALVLFSLLSLVPTLAKEWDFYSVHLAYLGLALPRYDGYSRYTSSLLRNASIDTRSRQRMTSGNSPCRSWLLGDFYSSCIEHDVPPHQSVLGTAPRRSLFEAGTEPGDNAVTYGATREPSLLTRGVTAFKEFVIKRWDDQQTIQHGVLDTASTQPALTVVNPATAVPLTSRESGQSDNEDLAEPPQYSLLFRLPTLLHETWQQACHAGGQYLESLSRSTTQNTTALIHDPAPATNDEKTHLDDARSHKKETSSTGSAQPEQVPLHTPPTSQPVSAAGQSKDSALRQGSEHMRGSSMAIVIGLVAGIMWF